MRACAPAVVVPLLLLAACSGGSQGEAAGAGPATSAPVTASSSAATPPSPSPSPSLSPSASALPTAASSEVPGRLLAGGVAAAALREGTVSSRLRVTGPVGIRGDGVADHSGAGTRLRLEVTMSGEKPVAVIRDGSATYLRLPAQFLPGKPWVQVSATGADQLSAVYRQAFRGYETPPDVVATADVLARIATFTVAGTQVIDGVPATRYTARTTARTAALLLRPAYLAINPTRMEAGRATVSVWVDQAGRLVRVASAATIPATERVEVQVDHTAWGEPVRIAAPPAAQVGRLPSG